MGLRLGLILAFPLLAACTDEPSDGDGSTSTGLPDPGSTSTSTTTPVTESSESTGDEPSTTSGGSTSGEGSSGSTGAAGSSSGEPGTSSGSTGGAAQCEPGEDVSIDVDDDGTPDCLQDVLVNSEFDADVDGWNLLSANPVWSAADLGGDPESGAIAFDTGGAGSVSQCVGVGGGKMLRAYVQGIAMGDVGPINGLSGAVEFFSDADCSEGGSGTSIGAFTGFTNGVVTAALSAPTPQDGSALVNFSWFTAGDADVRLDNPLVRLD